MTVRLQLSALDDIVSHAIMEDTRGLYSHVDIMTPHGTLIGARSAAMVINGVTYPAGVTERPAGYAPFTATKVLTFPYPPPLPWRTFAQCDAAFWTFVSAQLGKPYDTWAVLGLGADRDWHSPDKWFCSELAAAALEAGGYIPKLSTDMWFVSPRDIDLIGSMVA
jgi:hypothetical protein